MVPPQLACLSDLDERLLEACPDFAERLSYVRPNLETDSSHHNFKGQYDELTGTAMIRRIDASLMFGSTANQSASPEGVINV